MAGSEHVKVPVDEKTTGSFERLRLFPSSGCREVSNYAMYKADEEYVCGRELGATLL